jgi:predicted permease
LDSCSIWREGTTMLADLMFRLRALVRGRTVERELDEELRLHLEHEIQRHLQAGIPQPEAVRRAHLSFGGLEQVKEQCRQARGVALVETTLQDLRYALRTIRRSPGFATVAIVSLTLGIGANTAVFTLVDAVMFGSLPVRSPDELVSVGDPSRPTALWEGAPMLDVLSYPLYRRLRDENRVLAGLLASGRAGRVEMNEGNGGSEEVRARFVSGNYFDVLGISAAIGRTFSDEDDSAPGASPSIVISYGFWENRFARDPGILERTVRLNGWPCSVVGVGPRFFTGEVVGSPTDVWIPVSMQAQVSSGRSRLDRRDSNWLLGLGRLAPGVSLETARAELTLIAQHALADFEGGDLSVDRATEIRMRRLRVEPGAKGFSWVRKNASTLLFTLMAAVGLVLVIACANVANLLLARAMRRQKEISVRLAVGASRARLIHQMLTEGALLAAMGGAAGLMLARWGSRLLSQLAATGGPNPVPFEVDGHPNLLVLAFTGAWCVVTTILCALIPAVRSTRIEVSPALKEGAPSSESGGRSLGRLLVIGQLALSVPLLITAGLLVRSLAHLEALDVGYSRDNLVVVKTDINAGVRASITQRLSHVDALVERLRLVPGVLDVAVSENGLFIGVDSSTQGLQIEGFRPSRREDTQASFDQVGPRYFHVIGIPLLAGREFDERDTTGAPLVAVANETMATFYFGERSPLGKVIQNGGDRYTIVGVVKDNKQRDLKGKTERRFYIPLLQTTDAIATFNFSIRTRADSASMIPAIRRELHGFDGALKITTTESVRVLMSQTLSGERAIAQLSGLFAVLALALAAAGLYGVTSYATARRTNEIGLRMALGASRGVVIRMVLREALMLMAAGLAIGVPCALIAAQLTSATRVGVSGTDPAVIGGVALIMLIVGVCAAGVPALRAARVDPVAALRQE